MERRIRKMSLRKRIAAAVVAAALAVGAAGPIVAGPAQDDAAVETLAAKGKTQLTSYTPSSYRMGGSWS
jgi:hypothetical protein